MPEASEDPKEFVRRYLQEVFSEGKVDDLGEFIAGEAFTVHVKELLTRWRTAFPDLQIEVRGVLVDGDRVVTEERMTGTHTGPYESPWLGTVPPTGRSFTWDRIAIRDLADGRFLDGYWKGEELELFEQLGVSIRVDAEG
ncbi:MAG TPA: ester cyclase [Actinomycetota bacterium]|nr:ester cyclase [Actinomycetota bacterium]